jgi:hypothetical protein
VEGEEKVEEREVRARALDRSPAASCRKILPPVPENDFPARPLLFSGTTFAHLADRIDERSRG